jgi:Tfp pilus assembly protein PilN
MDPAVVYDAAYLTPLLAHYDAALARLKGDVGFYRTHITGLQDRTDALAHENAQLYDEWSEANTRIALLTKELDLVLAEQAQTVRLAPAHCVR